MRRCGDVIPFSGRVVAENVCPVKMSVESVCPETFRFCTLRKFDEDISIYRNWELALYFRPTPLYGVTFSEVAPRLRTNQKFARIF